MSRLLTYCTNIHPGESWADARRNLDSHLLDVKAAVSPDRPFPIGLRVSGQAAGELDAREVDAFRGWCEQTDTFVLTINGFPHGSFHGGSVKARVYSPDWRQDERVAYTKRLGDLLEAWLPEGAPGSISTVPIAFKPEWGGGKESMECVRRNLIHVLEHLDRIRQRGGAEIVLALEPEPCCVLETTDEVIEFFGRMDFPDSLRDLAGICFDCCHQAVEFEDPATSLALLARAGVRIGKVQVSSSLRAVGDEIRGLARFDEPTYLHQVVGRSRDGSLRRWTDLPEFLAERPDDLEECRVHFHVPIFAPHLGTCGTTRFFLEDILPRLPASMPLEVETYSWDVLPEALREDSVSESIAHELEWVEKIDAANSRS